MYVHVRYCSHRVCQLVQFILQLIGAQVPTYVLGEFINLILGGGRA